ncbi:MAG: phage virion morphogenesis protein [Mangrovibacterium sp.]
MSRVEGLDNFMRKLDQVEKAYNRMPTELAAIAVRFSKERFRDQAWLDYAREPWTARKQRRKGRRSQTLLVDKGYLKRSIRKVYASNRYIIIGTDAPYAQIQNDGGTIKKTVTVGAHTVKSHKRKAYTTRSRSGRKVRVKVKQIPAYNVKTHHRRMNTTIPARPFLSSSHQLGEQLIYHIQTRFEEYLKP